MITAVEGVRLGHWTDEKARTGCSVVVLPAGTVASGEVRGGAPGTREWALLDPRRTVDRVDAVVLAGGSAFGLAACDGVVRWCEERGIGWPTPAGPVPIVVGMVIYDLAVGDPSVRPTADHGYAACRSAAAGGQAVGRGALGAGAGATVGKWRGGDAARPAGLGSAVVREGDLVVAALVVVNAIGDPLSADGAGLARPRVPAGRLPVAGGPGEATTGPLEATTTGPLEATTGPLEATTVGVIVTNAVVDKTGCRLLAEAGHDGLARALDPVHTAADGDALVAAATGVVSAPAATVRSLAAWVVEQAVADGLAGPRQGVR